MFLSYLLLVLALLRDCISVRFEYLGVPGSVLRGKPVWLDCGYDLQDDELYSVKWYKDNYEFYRFLPGDHPPSQMLNLKGVYLDLYKSNATHAYLKTTDIDTEGSFACEVSTDGPSFRTVRAEKDLRVYVMPEADPIIVGVLSRYPIGEEINVTCFFGPSKPPAELNWYINGELAPSSYVVEQLLQGTEDEGIRSVESRLRFTVNPTHLFNGGTVSLQCTAAVSQVYSKSSEELIVGDATSGADFQRLTQVAPGQEGPSITGGMSKYDVGDLVDVNCTSARSVQAAELQWFINDKEAKQEYLLNHPRLDYAGGFVSTRLGLKFRVHEEHFRFEEMRLKCVSTLSKLIELSSVETVLGGNHKSSELYHIPPNGAADLQNINTRHRQCILIILSSILSLIR